MTAIPLTLQNVNGDPFVAGGNINITTGTTPGAIFTESGAISLSIVASGDTVTINGLVYTYDYLGSHDVRGDPLQPAAYIRIVDPLPSGSVLAVGDTFAIDLTGEPSDADYPNLANGNTKGSVAALDSTTPIQFPGVVCFALGTKILTPRGEISVENLQAGDLVETADTGPQPVLWLGRTKVSFASGNEKHKPILIAAQALGASAPSRDLVLSPQHKVLLIGTNGDEVLAPVKALASHRGVRIMNGRKGIEYFHLLLPAHSIIFAEGLAAESFYPGETAVNMLTTRQRREVEAVMPALKVDPDSYGPKARPALTRKQAEKLPNELHGLSCRQSLRALQSA